MNSFNFTLSEKYLICPSILNDSFAGKSNLGCISLLFMTWNISCQSLCACKVYFEKSSDSLMGTPLQASNYFSLAAFKILSLSLTFGLLIMMYLGVGLFSYILLWAFLFFLNLHVYFLCQMGSSPSLFVQIRFQFLALPLLLLVPL